ncbi:MAG TPA: V-type ATP synthase subunit I [Thermoplasmatales archaeon]|nr:V-type ATP synthase subunit I [Thermoplasmatales archaeon]
MLLFPAPMKKVSFIIHQSSLERVVTSLHESGLMQIIDISREDPKLLKEVEAGSVDPEVNNCLMYENRLSNLVGILKKYVPLKKGLKGFLSPMVVEKKTVKRKDLQTLYKETDFLLKKLEENILSLEKGVHEVEDRIEGVDETLQNLSCFLSFSFDLSYIKESEYVTVKAGLTSDVESVRKEVESLGGLLGYTEVGKKREKRWGVVAVCHISEKERLDVIWQRYVDDLHFFPLTGTPLEAYKRLQKEKEELLRELKRLKGELREAAVKHLNELLVKREEIQIERVRREVSSAFGKTNTTYVVEGWVLERNSEKLESLLTKVTGESVVCSFTSPSSNPVEPPVYLDMPQWMEPFKSILSLFSIPKYNEVNPAPFLVLWFPLMFGVMLGDAGYGVIIFLLSLVARFKWGKVSSFIRSWSLVGLFFGFWTIFFGFLFNSFFGDFVPRFVYGDENALLYQLNLMGYSIPLDALHKPLVILVIALLIGLVHLNFGFVLAMYQNFKRGEVGKVFREQVPWFLLQIGGGALVGEALLHIWDLSTLLFMVSVVFTVVGLIALFVNNRAMGFFELTGFVGDWLSYARLLALGLATSGMALAFNIVAQLMPKIIPYVGVVLLFLVLIFAHLANLLIQSLGAAIHSLRLQYVEFFNRFYEGGGKEFVPFCVRRRYTEEVK